MMMYDHARLASPAAWAFSFATPGRPFASLMVDPAAADRDLLLAARNGDQDAARALLEGHGHSMLKTAWRVLNRYGEAQAEDIVQEALLAAFTTTALPSGDTGAWLRSIVVRKALDWHRQHKRRSEDSIDDAPAWAELPAGIDEEHRSLSAMAVRQGLEKLSEKDRAVLVLVDLEGATMAEAASVIGATALAVKVRAVRARRRLAVILRESVTEGEK